MLLFLAVTRDKAHISVVQRGAKLFFAMSSQMRINDRAIVYRYHQPTQLPTRLVSHVRTSRTLCLSLHATKPTSQSPPVYIEDAATFGFLDWARSQGIQFGRLKPAIIDGERGLVANQSIGVDDIVIQVPRQLALTLPPKQRCPCQDFVSADYWNSVPWYVKLGIRLLHEQRKGPQSTYALWLQQLPRTVNSPVTWSPELVQQLQYPHLIHKVTEQQREWSDFYAKFVKEGLVDKASPPTKQEFFRALSLVRSRTFSGPYVASTLPDRMRLAGLVGGLVAVNTLLGGDLSKGLGAAAAVFLFNVIYEVVLSQKLRQYAMCPIIDLCNHSSLNTTEVSYDYPRDAFLVSAGTVYSQGQQVFISYGAQNNDSLMQMYGFAEPDNPYDVYVMTSLLKWLEQLQPQSQARLDRLNKDGLLSALQEVVITRQGFSTQTLQALRYLLLPPAASANGNGAAGLPALSPSSCATSADDDTEKKIALVLVHACQQELSAMSEFSANGSSTNGRSSRKSSSSGDLSAVQAVAAAFRHEKRRVLLSCLEQLTGTPAATAGAGKEDAASSAASEGRRAATASR